MELKDLTLSAGEWLSGSGPESEIAISTRIRLARNIIGFPFVTRMEEEQFDELYQTLENGVKAAKVIEDPITVDLKKVTGVETGFLMERHLISQELATANHACGVVFNKEETVSIMLNEEDHLRLQVIRSGFQPSKTWETINEIDNKLETKLDYSFSPRFGYLTACPTNVGTGMRVSVMLHLPGLVMTNQIEKVYHAVSKLNLAVRGLFGEGTKAMGDFYQISNQATLGRKEPDIVDTLKTVVPDIIKYEISVRKNLLAEQKHTLSDKIWRSYGILKYAKVLKVEESLDYLSALRMGLHLGLLDQVDLKSVNEIFILAQPAHLQKLNKKKLTEAELDRKRAELISERLGGGKPPKDKEKKKRGPTKN